MCMGSDAPTPTPAPTPAPPPVVAEDVELSGVEKKNKRQTQKAQRRGSSASRRDLKVNTTSTKSGLNSGA